MVTADNRSGVSAAPSGIDIGISGTSGACGAPSSLFSEEELQEHINRTLQEHLGITLDDIDAIQDRIERYQERHQAGDNSIDMVNYAGRGPPLVYHNYREEDQDPGDIDDIDFTDEIRQERQDQNIYARGPQTSAKTTSTATSDSSRPASQEDIANALSRQQPSSLVPTDQDSELEKPKLIPRDGDTIPALLEKKPGLWAHTKAVLKEGATTWVDSRRLKSKAEAVNEAVGPRAEKTRKTLENGIKDVSARGREKTNTSLNYYSNMIDSSIKKITLVEEQRNHYERNNYNNAPKYEKDIPEDWIKLSKNKSVFHQQGKGNENNVKYISPNGKIEGVYKNGNIVTDPLNMGTYNSASSIKDPIGHFVKDVLPYYFWGNAPSDPSTFPGRIRVTFSIPKEEKAYRKEE